MASVCGEEQKLLHLCDLKKTKEKSHFMSTGENSSLEGEKEIQQEDVVVVKCQQKKIENEEVVIPYKINIL